MELWFTEKHTKNVHFSIKVDKQLYSGQSDFQRIDIFESPEFGRFLTLDGYMMLTEKDEFVYHEMIVHVPMAVNLGAKKVLVIGGGDGGVVREGAGGTGTERSALCADVGSDGGACAVAGPADLDSGRHAAHRSDRGWGR